MKNNRMKPSNLTPLLAPLFTPWAALKSQQPYRGTPLRTLPASVLFCLLTGLVSWYVVFGLVQQGLHQVKGEQQAHLQATLNQVEASMQAQAAAVV